MPSGHSMGAGPSTAILGSVKRFGMAGNGEQWKEERPRRKEGRLLRAWCWWCARLPTCGIWGSKTLTVVEFYGQRTQCDQTALSIGEHDFERGDLEQGI